MRGLTMMICLVAMLMAAESRAQIERKTTSAKRIHSEMKIDGVLDEEAWQGAEVATGFIQIDPVPGDPASQKTEVRVLYDDDGIYVGAYLRDTNPQLILKEFSERDDRGNTEFFGVVFDTYRDGLNGFAFNITASGVQQDIKFSGGFEDTNWDGIWTSDVRITDDGWVAELYIPYLSLRFANVPIQEWNVNFMREIRRHREFVTWNRVKPEIEGFINQAGHLEGIKDIKSPVRLSITPFVTGYVNTVSGSGIDFDAEPAYTAGMDLKYGINDAFTLDMALIPDFGQVISDNQVLNLSPFEVFFEENRQFFTEGVELFNKGNLFYSRRVGGTPVNYLQAFTEAGTDEFVTENPLTTQLINATKVSGRTSRGTGLGFFNAVTAPQHATLIHRTTGEKRKVETSPLSNYNVLVADQNLPNNSVVTVLNTNVTRFGEVYDANTTGAFFSLRDKKQAYAVGGKIVSSNQYGDNIQTVSGLSHSLSVAKISGNWNAEVGYNVETDDYNINDMGFLFSPNEQLAFANVEYTKYKPKREAQQRWEVGLSTNYERLYAPNVFADFAINGRAFMLWKSRNALGVNFRLEPVETFDYFEPRTADFSQYMRWPTNWGAGGFFSSDYRKVFAIDCNVNYRRFDEPGRNYVDFGIGPRIRVNDRWSIFAEMGHARSDNETGYVFGNNTALTALLDGQIPFGRRDRRIYENAIRTRFIFTNNMFLNARIRHYWDQVTYDYLGGLQEDGLIRQVTADGSVDGVRSFDYNTNFFNIDLFYTWRFAPGSDMIFVWKQAISSNDDDFDASYFQNLGGLFDKFQTNSISLRIIYFLDYNTVRKSMQRSS